MLSKPIQLNTRVDQDTRDRLDAWRAAQRPILPTSEAVRHLIEHALDDIAPTGKASATAA
jgi:hypothetical protein